MLIDTSHPEETRVVVLDGQRLDEFDFEAASKRPLKGNIYLAKVTRVEPSLQAAFVEYGGNRQGFLAFSEIHPDYYQIPVADRQALLAEQQEEARRRSDDEFESVATGVAPASDAELEAEGEAEADGAEAASHAEDESAESEIESRFDAGQIPPGVERDESSPVGDAAAAPVEVLAEEESGEGIVDQQTVSEAAAAQAGSEDDPVWSNEADEPAGELPDSENAQAISEAAVESANPHSGEEHRPAQPLRSARPSQRWVRRRHYKIQEVIKRKQIMLVQVVKEERGTKGAALTTYLSLAGRYCVLMPNTPRGGGISRKITNLADRNRLKAAAATLELPEGMGLIIRTAGANRTKLEIKRDYEYLLRMWDQIRELTLQSNAPACVYEEGDIVKRAIRDLYNKDVSEILVEGEDGYRNAKEFMRMLMPSHAKNVKLYRDAVPLFQKYHIEAQLDAMFQPTVTLKSGGYIVINQTEALVSIDVNSGRATREHSIEETAHKTNLEAADEIGRQLRLRDLAGLIVIDFIDMEDSRNDRDVEKRLRDAVKNDRARVQIGKISQFGLLEMSRQRLRAGVVAGSTVLCPHCGGQGIVRSVESTALRVLRALEEEGQRGRAAAIVVHVANEVALYALNQKRRELARVETDYDMAISFEPKEGLIAGTFDLERSGQRVQPQQVKAAAVSVDAGLAIPTDMAEPVEDETAEEEDQPSEQTVASASPPSNASGTQQNGGTKKRRRRRRGRGGSHTQQPSEAASANASFNQATREPSQHTPASPLQARPESDAAASESTAAAQTEAAGASTTPSRRRRRRRKPRGGSASSGTQASRSIPAEGVPGFAPESGSGFSTAVTPNAPSEPVWSLGSDRAEAAAARTHETVGQLYYRREEALENESRSQATASTNRLVVGPEPSSPSAAAVNDGEPLQTAEETAPSNQAQRRGWWQRTFRKD